MSRNPHEPNDDKRELVKLHIALGTTQEDIGKVLGIDVKTLRKYYREELDTGATLANGQVGGALFNKAINGDTTAQIWWTKARMGWKETKVVGMDETVQPMTVNLHSAQPLGEIKVTKG